MRFYRVHFYDGSDGSFGYKFFTARAEAVREARSFKDDAKVPDIEVEAIEVEPTKAGILDALNAYASHANNG